MQDIPRLEVPLHTLIELVPKPDGKMAEERIHLDVLKSTKHTVGSCLSPPALRPRAEALPASDGQPCPCTWVCRCAPLLEVCQQRLLASANQGQACVWPCWHVPDGSRCCASPHALDALERSICG